MCILCTCFERLNCPGDLNEVKTHADKQVSATNKEVILDKAVAELEQERDAMRQQKALVERPFGTLKPTMGSTQFLVKRLLNARAEMSLHILAYDMNRAIYVLGSEKFISALQPA